MVKIRFFDAPVFRQLEKALAEAGTVVVVDSRDAILHSLPAKHSGVDGKIAAL